MFGQTKSVVTFNKIVTLDLKELGSKYILWLIDSFMWFVEGMFIPYKMTDTMVSDVNDCSKWNFAYLALVSIYVTMSVVMWPIN